MLLSQMLKGLNRTFFCFFLFSFLCTWFFCTGVEKSGSSKNFWSTTKRSLKSLPGLSSSPTVPAGLHIAKHLLAVKPQASDSCFGMQKVSILPSWGLGDPSLCSKAGFAHSPSQQQGSQGTVRQRRKITGI